MDIRLRSISELSNVNHCPSRYTLFVVSRYRFSKCDQKKSAKNLVEIYHEAFPQSIDSDNP